MTSPPITPVRAIQLIADNDPSFVGCNLSNNASYDMKSLAFTKDLAAALKSNTSLKSLFLSSVGVTDAGVKLLAEAIKENKTLTYLNLSKNKFGSAGLMDLAEALKVNETLLDIDLLGQTQPFGEASLTKVIEMFGNNITLKNISWRLNSRQSFAINKLIVRNKEIERRFLTGKSCADILPESRKAAEKDGTLPISLTNTTQSPSKKTPETTDPETATEPGSTEPETTTESDPKPENTSETTEPGTTDPEPETTTTTEPGTTTTTTEPGTTTDPEPETTTTTEPGTTDPETTTNETEKTTESETTTTESETTFEVSCEVPVEALDAETELQKKTIKSIKELIDTIHDTQLLTQILNFVQYYKTIETRENDTQF